MEEEEEEEDQQYSEFEDEPKVFAWLLPRYPSGFSHCSTPYGVLSKPAKGGGS